MRFFRIDWPVREPTEQATDWATSKRVADKIARESGDPDARVTEIDVPTDKDGLLAFLRKEIWCDAGRAIERARRG